MPNTTPLPPRGKNQPPPPRPPRKGSLSRHDDLTIENGIYIISIPIICVNLLFI